MIKIERKDACFKVKGNCWGCFHADECPSWLDIECQPAKINVKVNHVGLCKGRHEIPEVGDDYIFENTIEDVTNVRKMYNQAREYILNTTKETETKNLKLYITGLTPALCSVIAAANDLGKGIVHLTTMHYNKETGTYFEIPV